MLKELNSDFNLYSMLILNFGWMPKAPLFYVFAGIFLTRSRNPRNSADNYEESPHLSTLLRQETKNVTSNTN